MKDELGGKIMTNFATLRPKLYNHLTDDDVEDKKAKDTKKFVIKWNLKFEECKNCLEDTQLENKVDMISFREIHNKFIKNN